MADLDALVASPWWRWMGGMWWDARLGGTCPHCGGAGGFRWREADGSENGEECPCAGRIELYPSFRNEGLDAKMRACGVLPDPTDPATLGCLLALMYEAEPQHVTPSPVSVYLSQFGPADPRTVDAIVSAILAAPPPGVDRG